MAIVGVAACKAALDTLLDQLSARFAALPPADEDARTDAVIAANQQLSSFEAQSRPSDPSDAGEVAEIAALDALARKTRNDLTFGAIADIVARIKARADELEQLGQGIGNQTLANLETAKKLRLVPISNALRAAQTSIDALGVLKKQLKTAQPDEAGLAGSIEAALTAFDEVKTALASAST